MKAHITNDPISGKTRIWIVSEGPTSRHFLAPDLKTMTPFDEGDQIEPTLELDFRVAEVLGSALAEMGRPQEATSRHLADAIAIRDRLLAIVEKV